MPEDDKVRENRLRQMALRQRLHVRKTRRRDRRAFDYGLYRLFVIETDAVWAPAEGPGMTIDELEEYLLDEDGPRPPREKAKWVGAPDEPDA